MVIGVSPDSDESHRQFKERHRLDFALVADEDGKLSELYGVRRRFGLGSNKRVTYVIGKDGLIRGVFHHELAIGRHRADVLKALVELNSG